MITHHEYLNRQKKLLGMVPDNSIIIIFAAHEILRNGDAHYKFRQNSNFWYLTGFNEPDAVLLLSKTNHNQTSSIIFCKSHDPKMEQWTGKRLGPEGAKHLFGFNEAFSIDEFPAKLPEFIKNHTNLIYPFDLTQNQLLLVKTAVNTTKKNSRKNTLATECILDLNDLIGELRLFKSAEEINLMRQAANISVAAHRRAMHTCKNFEWEYQLEAELLYEFLKQGAKAPAYDSIVGSGANGCVLHYTQNNQKINKNQLILIDAACEFHNYAADITRTFPANGYFNQHQKAIYELVLEAQKQAIKLIKPGLPWDALQTKILEILTQGLVDLKILSGNVAALIADKQYLPYYMHSSGHWLGLDVHDAGKYWQHGKPRILEPGMVLTVEPGLYLSSSIPNLNTTWYNIGIRIEDDILVTADGHENLTASLPKEISEIEHLING